MSNFLNLKTPRGFRAAGMSCGIKSSGSHDIAIFVSDVESTVVGMFTTNRVQAAPVRSSRERLSRTGGHGRAIVVTSGNANAATGAQGREVVEAICQEVSGAIGCDDEQVLIAQTGIIGIPLDRTVSTSGAVAVTRRLVQPSWEDAARGMMTTDTHPKCSWRQVEIAGIVHTVTGFAKGVAMAAPSMATMIVVLLTDAKLGSAAAGEALRVGVQDSFHQLNIDGCQSTNDTIFLMANGEAGGAEILDGPSAKLFHEALQGVCDDLVRQMAGDAEGGTKLITAEVRGAVTRDGARTIARRIVGSSLVKCAIAGECPYWGRVIAEVGAAGVEIDPDNISISFGPHRLCDKSLAVPFDHAGVTAYLKGREVVITVELTEGTESARAYGSDLTPEYVKINMEKS
jgi:glutamate N-acetyltransferase/amino-acid N-acetyltransferase